MRVLSKVPGLAEALRGHPLDALHVYSAVSEDGGLLGVNGAPRRARAASGLGSCVVDRRLLLRRLVERAQGAGVEIRRGHKFETLEQAADGVGLAFANGARKTTWTAARGAFCLGSSRTIRALRSCGCMSGVRAFFLTIGAQYAGSAPAPEMYRGEHFAADMYGDGAHMLVAPNSETTVFWA